MNDIDFTRNNFPVTSPLYGNGMELGIFGAPSPCFVSFYYGRVSIVIQAPLAPYSGRGAGGEGLATDAFLL